MHIKYATTKKPSAGEMFDLYTEECHYIGYCDGSEIDIPSDNYEDYHWVEFTHFDPAGPDGTPGVVGID